MDYIENLALDYFKKSDADQIAIGKIDFKNKSFEKYELGEDQVFDLASLTKPFINSFNHIKYEVSDSEMSFLLNHQAGLPSWARLSKSTWKNDILSFPIKRSQTLYSDLSALRYMLEFEKRFSIKAKGIIEELQGMFFWLDCYPERIVHDINSFNLKEFTSHAGLFGTVDNVCEFLLYFNKQYDLLKKIKQEMINTKDRFILGFDRVENINDSLAGKGCGIFTFGHLGFTGTSFWIDIEKEAGHIILTNSTKYYWYNKKYLNDFRKECGKAIWSSLN